MRGSDITQVDLFSYRTLEERIPANHPLRKLRLVVDAILGSMDRELNGLYANHSHVSILPERLPRASLLQTLFSIRSERQLVAHIDYNLLYRWFVGLGWIWRCGITRHSALTGIDCSTKPWPVCFCEASLCPTPANNLLGEFWH